MPKTRPQKVFFSIVMAVLMVYPMELYNLALQEGGLSNGMLWRPLLDLPLMGVLVILLESLIAGPICRWLLKLVFRTGKSQNPAGPPKEKAAQSR